ncbi:PTS sugar transporter subunit IIA [Alkalibacter saccharofermentans]|nr:PTS glucose transporter subunit IIA [Alkalibacter saccharofermentans]
MFKKILKRKDFFSPMEGELMRIDQVEDEVFSTRSMGDGFAIDFNGVDVKAPTDGEVIMAFPTGHAIGIKNDNMEYLIHIGMDTVELEGEGFELCVAQGDRIKQGDVIVKVDKEKILEKGKSLKSPIVFLTGEKIEVLSVGRYVKCMEKNIIKIK